MREELDKLVKKGYLYDYKIENNELIIRYGLSSVGETERVIDIENKSLKQAILESAKEVRVDIECSLEDENDFFGYNDKEELEDRIVEETDYLNLLSELVKDKDFKGKTLKVIEDLKNEIIYQVKMIKLDDKDFDTDEVELIKMNIEEHLDIINGIYQDLIIGHITRDTEIEVKENYMGELYYEIGDEDNE